MATLREQIVDAIITALNTGTPGGVPAAKRSYTYGVDATQLPVVNVFWLKDQPLPAPAGVSGVPVRHNLIVAVEVITKGSSTDRPDEVADAGLAWVVKALDGKRPAPGNTGPYHVMQDGGAENRLQQKDHAYCVARALVAVSYQHKQGDAETWA